MKASVGNEWPYKDQRGQWIIVIQRDGDNYTVTHTKKEISWEDTKLYDTQHFQFTWSLRMEFDSRIEEMTSVSVRIDEMEFPDTVPAATRDEIVNAFNNCPTLEAFSL